MDVLMLTYLAIIWTIECYHCTKAMGICGFAKRFPCEERGGPVCCTSSGCKKQNKTKSYQVTTSATTTPGTPPTDCLDVYNRGNIDSGVYYIKPATWSGSPFEVYCNMTDGTGWTVFQRRIDGSVNFNRYWNDYKNGFGTPDHEFWLGNEKLLSLTNQRSYQLRIDFVNKYGQGYSAKYDFFLIHNEATSYRLTIGTYSGDAGDSFTDYHNNQNFRTRDKANCNNIYNPIVGYVGGWWYGCNKIESALNANYLVGGVGWFTLPGDDFDIKYTEMKVRPG